LGNQTMYLNDTFWWGYVFSLKEHEWSHFKWGYLWQLLNFIHDLAHASAFTACNTATFCPPNNLMHSLLTTTSSHDVSHKLLSHCTNIVWSLFTSCTSTVSTVKTVLKQCYICEYNCLMWHNEHMNTVTGSLTVGIDITCTRCVAHTHLDTFTAHHYRSWNKNEELLQNTRKQNWLILLESQKNVARLTLLTY
jgi:hypothetical protein